MFRTPGSTIVVARIPWSALTTSAYIRSLDQPGCYAIVSQSDDPTIDSSVYVGSSGQIKRRLPEHKRDKRNTNALWIYVISASSLDVTSSHMRQLEGILRRTTAVQPRAEVTSEDVPAFPMSPRDEAIMTVMVMTSFQLLAAAAYPLNAHGQLIIDHADYKAKAVRKTPVPTKRKAAAPKEMKVSMQVPSRPSMPSMPTATILPRTPKLLARRR